jgi:hypothetical protein
MGDLLLTDKEATGLVIRGVAPSSIPKPKWAAVGKVCSTRRLVISALERAMHKAWGLRHVAQFKDIGDNRFMVRFNSEGDWKHVMRNGPWQFDFNAVLLKEYDGVTRPSDMVFETLDIHSRVLDLPMDMMNRTYGELIGGWIGKYISVDVDEEGMAWGEDLRIRVAIRVDQPILRGVTVKTSDDDKEGRWFDIQYEKIPHFCFECGRIVHPDGVCTEEAGEVKQWGEWLRAAPKKTKRPPPPVRPAVSSDSYGSRSTGSETRFFGGPVIRDIPPRRNYCYDYAYSGSSRTGRDELRDREGDVTSPDKRHRARAREEEAGKQQVEAPGRRRSGTYVRKQRQDGLQTGVNRAQGPPDTLNRKRSTKQVWQPVAVQVIGEGSSESSGKRQRTGSVFDRLEQPAADPEEQGRRAQ